MTGYAPADFILGTPQSFTTPGPEVRGRVAEWRDGFFVLDKWQVSRKLTLNYGLRYELPTVPYTINGVATELNREPDGAGRGHARATTSSHPTTRTGRRAWDSPTASTRRPYSAAGGHLLQSQPDQQLHVPEHQSAVHHDSDLHVLVRSGSQIPTLSNPFVRRASVRQRPQRALIVTAPWHQPTQRMNQWSAGLERQFGNGAGLEVQYLGSHSYHLDRSFYNNTPLVPGPGPVNSRRPNQLFGADPHHQHRRDRQLRKHVRDLPPAPDARLEMQATTPGRTRWTSHRTPTAAARR